MSSGRSYHEVTERIGHESDKWSANAGGTGRVGGGSEMKRSLAREYKQGGSEFRIGLEGACSRDKGKEKDGAVAREAARIKDYFEGRKNKAYLYFKG